MLKNHQRHLFVLSSEPDRLPEQIVFSLSLAKQSGKDYIDEFDLQGHYVASYCKEVAAGCIVYHEVTR